MTIDESFDVGVDTRTGVDDADYQVRSASPENRPADDQAGRTQRTTQQRDLINQKIQEARTTHSKSCCSK
jgi:hypothetical protein